MTVDDMKAVELEIADKLDEICRAHGIRYFLAYGSLLGAVRHGGFIPWDDDMDVVMPRPDYERFIENFPQWCDDPRFALSFYREGNAIYPFAKMCRTSTLVRENFVRKDRPVGVWVDIFPLEEVDPKNRRPFQQVSRLMTLYNFAVADPSVGSTALVKAVKRAVCPVASRFDPLKLAARMDAIARRSNAGETGVYADILGSADPDLLFPAEWFEPVDMAFEGRMYRAPAGYEEFLTRQYGDWRTPPAEDDRAIHTCEAYRL